MPDEIKTPKYLLRDEIEVPAKELESWQITADLLAEVAEVPAALIMRAHASETEVFVSSHSADNVYHPGMKAALDTGLYCETVMNTGSKLLVPNALTDPAWAHNPDIKLGMISFCGLPLTWPTGEIFGTICILDKKENTFNHRVHPMLERFRDMIQLSLSRIYEVSLTRIQLDEAQNDLRDSELKYRALFESAEDAILLFSDGHWIDCNPGALRVFGCTREQIIGAHPSRFSPATQPNGRSSEAEAVRLINLAFTGIAQVFEWEHCRLDGTPFDAEVTLNRLDLGGKLYMLAIVRDITVRKRAEESLRTEKANLDAIFESSPVALLILDEATNIVRANSAAIALTGGRSAAVLHHRPGNALSCIYSSKDPRGCGYGPECPLCPVRNGIEAVIASGHALHRVELMLELMRDGAPQTVWMEFGAESLQIDGRRHLCVAMEDISAHKNEETMHAARLHLIEFSADHSLDELLEEILNEAEKLSGSVIGFYHFVEDDQVTLTLQNWSTRTKAKFCRAEGKGAHYAIDKAGVWVDCLRERKPLIHNDYASLPHRKGMPEGHAEVIRELVVPVMQGDRVMAILGVGNKPADYTPVDINVVSQLADLAWQIAVRKQVEEALRLSKERLSLATIAGGMGIWELDVINNKLTWDAQMFRLYGLTPDDFGGAYENWKARVHPEDVVRCDAEVQMALRGENELDSEFRVVWPGGTIRHIAACAQVQRNAVGQPVKLIGLNYDITERTQAQETLQQKAEELRTSNVELEQFNRAAVGRELRMIELKQEIDVLCRRLGEAPRYGTGQYEGDRIPGAGLTQKA